MLVYAAPVDGGMGGVNSLGWSIAFGPSTVGLFAVVLGLRHLALAAGGVFLLLALVFTPWGLGFYELPAAVSCCGRPPAPLTPTSPPSTNMTVYKNIYFLVD
jgi:hypothetical protein